MGIDEDDSGEERRARYERQGDEHHHEAEKADLGEDGWEPSSGEEPGERADAARSDGGGGAPKHQPDGDGPQAAPEADPGDAAAGSPEPHGQQEGPTDSAASIVPTTAEDDGSDEVGEPQLEDAGSDDRQPMEPEGAAPHDSPAAVRYVTAVPLTAGVAFPADLRDFEACLQGLSEPAALSQVVLAICGTLAAPQDRISIRYDGRAVNAVLNLVQVGRVAGLERAAADMVEAIDKGREEGSRAAIAAYTQHMSRYKKEVEYREEARARGHVVPGPQPERPAEPRAARPVGCLADRDLRGRLDGAHRDAGLLVINATSAPSLRLPRRSGARPLACEAIEGSARSGIACGRRARICSVGAAEPDQLIHWASGDGALNGLVFLPQTALDSAPDEFLEAVRHVASLAGPRDFVLDPPEAGRSGVSARSAFERSAGHAQDRTARLQASGVRVGEHTLKADPGGAHGGFAASAPDLTCVLAVGLHLLDAGRARAEPGAVVQSTTVRRAGIVARHLVDYGLRVLAPAAAPRALRDARLVYNFLGTHLRGEVALSTITRALAEQLDAGRIGEALALLVEIGLVDDLEPQKEEGKPRERGRPPRRFRLR